MPEKPKRQIPETESVATDVPPLDEENLAPESKADTTILPKMRSQMKGWETKARAKDIELQQEKIQEEARRRAEIKKVRREIENGPAEEIAKEETGVERKIEPVSMEEINAESARWRETVNRLEREGKITQEYREKKYDPEFEIVAKELEAYEKETEHEPLLSRMPELDEESMEWKETTKRLEKKRRGTPPSQQKKNNAVQN